MWEVGGGTPVHEGGAMGLLNKGKLDSIFEGVWGPHSWKEIILCRHCSAAQASLFLLKFLECLELLKLKKLVTGWLLTVSSTQSCLVPRSAYNPFLLGLSLISCLNIPACPLLPSKISWSYHFLDHIFTFSLTPPSFKTASFLTTFSLTD